MTRPRAAAMRRWAQIKATLHWVSVAHALEAEARCTTICSPDLTRTAEDFTWSFNSNSLEVLTGCELEPSLANAKPGDRFQFERQGYFCVDPESKDSSWCSLVSRLKDTWAKMKKGKRVNQNPSVSEN